MRFYTNSHQHYCGVDLHTKTLYLCILDSDGNILLHKNINANPESFIKAIDPYREDLVVGVECMFSWYWLANLCLEQGIAFLLGHALYMKSIPEELNKQGNRASVAELFDDPAIVKNVQVDLNVADTMHAQIVQLENYIVRHAKAFDPRSYYNAMPRPLL